MTTPVQKFGFFGKVPCAGDFVRRDLSQGFVSAWDAWIQQTIQRSEQRLGPSKWHNAYMHAPIWRFAIRAGLCGPNAVTGVLMPSVDAVGRRYPLCIATEVALPAWSALTAFGPTLRVVELVALNMLNDDASLPRLEADLAQLPVISARSSGSDTVGSVWASEVQDEHLVFSSQGMPDSTAISLFDLAAPLWAKTCEPTP